MDVFLVQQESNVDGDVVFDVTPCKDRETAEKLFNEKIKSIRSEGHFDHEDEDFTVSEAEGHYFITDECDDYYEDITIEKAKVL